MQDIVDLGRNIGLNVNEEDIAELVEGHDQELTTQELVDLQAEAREEPEEEEEAERAQLSTSDLKKFLDCWQYVQTIAQQYHEDTNLAMNLSNSYDERIVSPF